MSQETLRIGEVAVQAEVNIQTLRYYERRGLLKEPERRSSVLRLREHHSGSRAEVRAMALENPGH